MVFRLVIRFIVSALVLLVMSTFLPGFQVVGFVNALIAAVAIAVLGYLAELVVGEKASPQSRGLIGFISAAVVIFLAQFIVPTMSVTVFGALLAAVIIGLVDAFVPTVLR